MTRSAVLHLCSDYARQRLYPELFASLHDAGVAQSVYVPVRTATELSVARPPRAAIGYHARYVLRPAHRVLFRTKVRTVTEDVLRLEDPRRYGVIHAHFLYSDGAVALRLHESSGTPFISAVRNTDLNAFMRLRPDLRWVMHRIVRAARMLVFLSPAYRDEFLARLPRALARSTSSRCVVVPNGLAPEWFEPPPPLATRPDDAPLRVLYVGDFSENKNVRRLLEATARLRARRQVALTLVGGGGSGDGATAVQASLASGQYPWVQAIGRVDDQLRLRALYREHDVFAMPSLRETFGLVYVEAWSQGLPVVLARGQGVDGYFPSGTVTEAVDPRSVDSIAEGLAAAAQRAAAQRAACIAAAQTFSWPQVAATYRALYESVAQTAGAV